MQATITHSTTTQGMMTKTTYFSVGISVQFSPDEASVIQRYDIGSLEILDREHPASLRKSNNPEGAFNMRVSHLVRGDTYLCATPLEAKTYDSKLRDALSKVKAYIDANMTPMSGSDTFEVEG